VNLAAWVPLAGLILIGSGAQWVAGQIKVGGVQNIAQWIAGLLAVTCYLQAGVYATRTFIGGDVVPFIVGLHPAVLAAAGLAVIAAVVFIVLAVIPDRWSTLAASSAVLALAFLAPSLVPFLPAGDVGGLARDSLAVLTTASAQVTDGWFE
jgi:hypothetical protein